MHTVFHNVQPVVQPQPGLVQSVSATPKPAIIHTRIEHSNGFFYIAFLWKKQYTSIPISQFFKVVTIILLILHKLLIMVYYTFSWCIYIYIYVYIFHLSFVSRSPKINKNNVTQNKRFTETIFRLLQLWTLLGIFKGSHCTSNYDGHNIQILYNVAIVVWYTC